MERDDPKEPQTSFLGTGWSFPPEFSPESGTVLMTSDERDIEASLRILFGTRMGERFLVPDYGLDVHDILFDPMSTSLRTFLEDRVRTALLVYEPRIRLLSLNVDSPHPSDGRLHIELEYEIRATNSRYNLVFPFYRWDGNEQRGAIDDRKGTAR
jgi:phage baseplate assembly protein W